MKLDWPHDICVGCKKRFVADDPPGSRRRSEAHVVPEALGGKLRVTALCVGCNGLVGHRFEDQLPLKPPYRDEIERFAHLVPQFETQLRKPGRSYVAPTEDGPLTLKRDSKTGDLRVVDTTLPSGRYKDSRDAASEIRSRLERQGAKEDEIKEILRAFNRGESVGVGADTYVPRTGDLVPQPEYKGFISPDEAYLAAAFMWLVCVVESYVYRPELDGVRLALFDPTPRRDGSWQVERWQTPRESEPWHRLALTETIPCVVEVTLFGRWLYKVKFGSFNWPGSAWGYRIGLDTGHEVVRDLPWVNNPEASGAK